MSHDKSVITRYGSVEQKRAMMVKEARYKVLQEVDWRKLSVQGWEALKKEAELGSRTYYPNDAMVIGILGEECFDSFKEYKELQLEHPDKDFVQLASAMVDLNKTMVDSLTKVAGLGKHIKMVKIANTKAMDTSAVLDVARKIAKQANHKTLMGKVEKFASSVEGQKTVDVKTVKEFFNNNNVFGVANELI